jgi:hypothetical protein
VQLPALEAAATVALYVCTGAERTAAGVDTILFAPVPTTCSKVQAPFYRTPASVRSKQSRIVIVP